MKLFSAALLTSIFLVLGGGSALAAKKNGIGEFSGSYTGTSVAKSAGTTLSGSATLTFTGKKSSLAGTFLYNGWLNQSDVLAKVDQTFKIGTRGTLAGRVMVGDRSGTGAGKVTLSKKTLRFSITYKLTGEGPASIQLVGNVVFAPKRAIMTAVVTSSDGSFNGSLKATGTR